MINATILRLRDYRVSSTERRMLLTATPRLILRYARAPQKGAITHRQIPTHALKWANPPRQTHRPSLPRDDHTVAKSKNLPYFARILQHHRHRLHKDFIKGYLYTDSHFFLARRFLSAAIMIGLHYRFHAGRSVVRGASPRVKYWSMHYGA